MAGWIIFCALIGLLIGGWAGAGKGVAFPICGPLVAVAILIFVGALLMVLVT